MVISDVYTPLRFGWHQLKSILNIRQMCHSGWSEEPGVRHTIRFLASLGMTPLLSFRIE